jgi:hypothetical protein
MVTVAGSPNTIISNPRPSSISPSDLPGNPEGNQSARQYKLRVMRTARTALEMF